MLVVTRSPATRLSTCFSSDAVSWILLGISAMAATTRPARREAGAVDGAVVASVDGAAAVVAVVVVVGSAAGALATQSIRTRKGAQRVHGIRRCFPRGGRLRQGQNQAMTDSRSAG